MLINGFVVIIVVAIVYRFMKNSYQSLKALGHLLSNSLTPCLSCLVFQIELTKFASLRFVFQKQL
jgi:hypothetical protein